MVLKDRRCLYCNWLNREVSESFACKNCNKSNQIKQEATEEVVVEKNVKSNSTK